MAQLKLDLNNASTGDPIQVEARSALTVPEAIDRRTIRQAIMTQLLIEIADEIINKGARLEVVREDGEVVKSNLMTLYNSNQLPLLRALIKDPEAAFNARRNKLFVEENPKDPSAPPARKPFGSINLAVFRNAMALGDGKSPLKPEQVEEVAKRVMIRAGRSSGYGKRLSEAYDDRGFAGCK